MITLAATTRAAPPTGRSAATVVWPSTSSTMPTGPDHDPDGHARDEPAPTPAVGVGAEERHHVVVDEGLLGLVGVAPDQDQHAEGEEGGPPDEPDEAEVQRARDHLHRDQHRDEDGGDQADAAAVVDGAASRCWRSRPPWGSTATPWRRRTPSRRCRWRAARSRSAPRWRRSRWPTRRRHTRRRGRGCRGSGAGCAASCRRGGDGAGGHRHARGPRGATSARRVPPHPPAGGVPPARRRDPRPGRGPRRLGRAPAVGQRARAGIGYLRCLFDPTMIARAHHRGYQGHP